MDIVNASAHNARMNKLAPLSAIVALALLAAPATAALKEGATAPAFVAKANEEIRAILADPAVIERLRKLGSDVVPTTPQGFHDRVADDVAKWTKVVAEANIPRV